MRNFMLAAVLFLGGCCSNAELLDAADKFHKSVGAEYKRRVLADEELTDDEKKTKILNVDMFGVAVREAKK